MKAFHKNGYVVIPNYWPEEKCSSLVEELDALFFSRFNLQYLMTMSESMTHRIIQRLRILFL